MDKIKKFFQKKKVDATFKMAGQGHRLGEPGPSNITAARVGNQTQSRHVARSSTEAQAKAAEAAVQRLHVENKPSRSAQAIRAQALKELEAEKQRSPSASSDATDSHRGPEERDFEAAPVLAVSGVFFTCELLPEPLVLPRDLMIEQVEQFLREQFTDEPLVASSVLIHSLNANRERRQEAIGILSKYLDNLITEPDEAKYRKIRTSNKVFSEKVQPVKGCYEFLEAVGFHLAQEGDETFLVISEEDAKNVSALIQAKEMIVEGEPVPLKLHRNPSVLRPSACSLGELGLPPDFFDRTAAEVKQEQKARADELDKLCTLRTKEMRERDELKRIYRYKYTLLRIRFPDGYMLQGTFSSAERVSAVDEFVQQHLQAEWAPFVLKDPRGEPLRGVRTDTKSLGELGLAPASVLHFEWDPDMPRYAAAAGQPVAQSFLKSELLEEARDL